MTQNLEHHPEKTKGNIVLVGVAGVGKSTLGKFAAEKLGMSFVKEVRFDDPDKRRKIAFG